MSRSRANLRQLTIAQLGVPFISGTTVSSTATTLVDIPILGAFPNAHFNGAHAYLPDQTPTDVRVQASTQVDGTLTTIPSDSGRTGTFAYEIMPYPGLAVHQALDDALQEGYDRGWLVRNFWVDHWLTGSPIYNPTFDYWTSATVIDGWTSTGITLARISPTSTTYVLPGRAFIVDLSDGTGTLDLNTTYEPYLADFRSHAPILRMLCFATVASEVRAQILVDGSVVGSTEFHTGDSNWQMVSSDSISISSNAMRVGIRIDVPATTGPVYAGAIWLENGPRVIAYPFPVGLMPDGPDTIYTSNQDVNESDLSASPNLLGLRHAGEWDFYRYRDEGANTETGMILFEGRAPVNQKRLWMPGSARLTLASAVSSDSASEIEVQRPEDLLLAKMAALKLLEKDTTGSGLRQSHKLRLMSSLSRDIDTLSEGAGAKSVNAVALSPNW